MGRAGVVEKLGVNLANGRIVVKDLVIKGRAFLMEVARMRDERERGSRKDEVG